MDDSINNATESAEPRPLKVQLFEAVTAGNYKLVAELATRIRKDAVSLLEAQLQDLIEEFKTDMAEDWSNCDGIWVSWPKANPKPLVRLLEVNTAVAAKVNATPKVDGTVTKSEFGYEACIEKIGDLPMPEAYITAKFGSYGVTKDTTWAAARAIFVEKDDASGNLKYQWLQKANNYIATMPK